MSDPDRRHRDFMPSATLDALAERASLLRRLRGFFYQRGFVEVETPLAASEIIPELHIEPMAASSIPGSAAWLQASPELYMKRLMAAGAEAIFQVTRSFRAGERGRVHNPEFTIVEWYRRGDEIAAGMDLLDALLQATLGAPPAVRTTYAEAFERQFGFCPHSCAIDELIGACEQAGLGAPPGVKSIDRDEWLNLLLAMRIEPELGRDRPEFLYHYPASQASLARLVRANDGYNVAERFEVYYRGIELANGFCELTDAVEQRKRFEEVNAARLGDGRRALPLPESLLAAIEHGLPDCTGCALGFDRLAMLSIGATSIDNVMAFPSASSGR